MASANGPDGAGGLRSLGRALAHRNYRLFFGGQGVSLVGTWMTRVASYWLVYRLGGPPDQAAFLLGCVGFAGQAPTFFLAPFAGAVVDRTNRQRLLVVTQALALVQSALLAVVAFLGEPGLLTIAAVLLLSLFQGVINAFDMPARQAFLIEMVTRKEDLPNAIALNSSLVNGARLVGPSLAGLLIYQLGQEGWCFLIDAVSYVAVIAALLAMRVTPRAAAPHRPPLWRSMREGFAYAFGFPPIRALLLLSALVSFMGMPYTVLLPLFAAELRPGAGAQAYGFLSAAAGVGALTGALYLAGRKTVLGLGRIITAATTTFGLGLVGFALSENYWLSLAALVLVGLGMMVQLASSNTILQTIAEEDKRGRVMSFYSMSFMGMAPFGSLFAGFLAGLIGPEWTVGIGGLTCLLGAALFALNLPKLRSHVRPLYRRLGILPEVASGLQQAAELTRAPAD